LKLNEYQEETKVTGDSFIFNEYQAKAKETAIYNLPIIYPTIGLNGEAGEVAENVKKMIRDDGGILTEERRQSIIKELGDVLWYLANLASDIGVTLDEVACQNLEKLNLRKEKGVLKGDGDTRELTNEIRSEDD